jgi:hypothetical protein
MKGKTMFNKFVTIFFLFALLLLAFPVVAQEADSTATVDTTAVIIGAFVTVGVMALGVVFAAVSSGKNAVEAAKAGGESAVRGIISNKPISEWGEDRLNHVPASIRNAMTAIVDVFDPATASTQSDLDNKTQEWIRNLLDGNPETGAVDFDNTK